MYHPHLILKDIVEHCGGSIDFFFYNFDVCVYVV